ncbi:MAG: U32 family peptidase C-terminal domain-containing protein, partial [Nitrospiraceae bacterium]
RNNIHVGDNIEYLSTGLEGQSFEVKELFNTAGFPIERGRNEETVALPMHPEVRKYDLVRRKLKD